LETVLIKERCRFRNNSLARRLAFRRKRSFPLDLDACSATSATSQYLTKYCDRTVSPV